MHVNKIRDAKNTRVAGGYLMLLALVFGSIFLTVLSALAGYAILQNRIQVNASGRAKSLALAESGLEYYRWRLAHFPNDLQNGTGQPGPYEIPQYDPEGGLIGTATLDIVSNQSCGIVTSVDITSTGRTNDGSGAKRTIVARYAQPSVAQFSYIINSSVWAGADRIINGPYHANGGIRMDGTANAPVTSSLSSWLCTSDFGCSPNSNRNGVFGAGPNQGLWNFPQPQVDFAGIAADLPGLKTRAQANGLYFSRFSTGNANGAAFWRGYHLIFNSNGTVTVRRVTSTTELSVTPMNPSDPSTDRTLINNSTNLGTYTIPSTCGLIFVEDNAWIEGQIPSKVTVVVANVTNTGVAPNAYLPDNITYANADAGLTVIAQNNVLITADAPNTMRLSGVFIAQNGAFGRNLYRGCPSAYEPRNSLTITGTTVSNLRTGTRWVNGCGSGADGGFQTRVDGYDRRLATDPPPFTPITSSDYEFVDWREK